MFPGTLSGAEPPMSRALKLASMALVLDTSPTPQKSTRDYHNNCTKRSEVDSPVGAAAECALLAGMCILFCCRNCCSMCCWAGSGRAVPRGRLSPWPEAAVMGENRCGRPLGSWVGEGAPGLLEPPTRSTEEKND